MIYTAVTSRDAVRTDIKCFTEKVYTEFKRPVLNAKIFKVFPYDFIDTDYSIWVDGNIFPLVEDKRIVELLGDADMALWKHPTRTTVEEELGAIKHYYPEMSLYAENYWLRLQKEGFKDDLGLYECNVLIRRHNEPIKQFMALWWEQITRWCSRDQMSFPYCLSKVPIKLKVIEEDKSLYFKRINHVF